MQLFYNPDINPQLKTLTFNKEESRHIVKVLRKKVGDPIYITDGNGRLYAAEVLQEHDKKCIVEIKSSTLKPKIWDYHLHIAIAPTKMNDRLEWFLEKTTEIGIDEITPILCEHSERRHIKMDRLEKVIISGMKQSLKYQLPKLNEAKKFKEVIRDKNFDLGLIAHCEDSSKMEMKDFFPEKGRILIFIGPEGDFSPNEIELAKSHGIHPVTLGQNRLRTETAGIVACTYTALLNEVLS